jgi:hypothetical protein
MIGDDISVYDKLMNNLKGYAVPYEDHPQQSTRDFEYDHPLTGIENDRVPNIDGLSFNIDGLDDLSFNEIQLIHNKLSDAANMSYMREYVEEPGGGGEELFTYYQGTTGPYVDKRLPRTSAIHIRNLRNHVNSVMYEKKRTIRDQEAEDLLPTLEKYLEKHRKTNPNIYPDWLKFKFKEVRWGDLYIQPIINLEKLLKSGQSISQARKTRDFITKIWNRLVNANRPYGRRNKDTVESPSVKTTYVLFEDFKDYMKNVVNKKIKPEIKNLPRGKECVHSIIFRYRKTLNEIEIQIHPRFRSECTQGYWNRFDTYEFEKEIKGILSTYGWREGVNYTTSTNKD